MGGRGGVRIRKEGISGQRGEELRGRGVNPDKERGAGKGNHLIGWTEREEETEMGRGEDPERGEKGRDSDSKRGEGVARQIEGRGE